MNELEPRYEITRSDLVRDKALKIGAWSAPILFSVIPALIFFFFFLVSSAPPVAFTWFFLTIVSLIGGFIFGLLISGSLMFYRSRWLSRVRERLAVDGIKANEVDWFTHELTSNEKKSLKEIESRNLLLADAFRDTLAARLTATRILKSAKQELLLVQRRQGKLKYLKSENSTNLQNELKTDLEKLTKIKNEAEEMRVEAETRIQMIEAASRRGGNLADTELALKKLSARTQELPMALESAKMEDEMRRELERELEKDS
jgi:uncharacterized integral membrane protein